MENSKDLIKRSFSCGQENDTISRQAVKDALVERTILEWEQLKTCYPMLEAVDEVPPAQPEQRWIPVDLRNNSPDLNPEPDLKGEILEAVEILKEKYEEAKKISYINKPFEYALYHTWKEFDGRNKVTR